MRILGLTGSLAMGKSTAADMLRRLGIPVHDADATIHRLFNGPAVPVISKIFPDTIVNGTVNRLALGDRVLGNPVQLKQLEDILHPFVRLSETRFLQRAATQRETLVVLDIPLLFETHRERVCDAVAVVTAPRFLQTQRAMRRVGMTLHKLEAIRHRQMSEYEKRRRATFVIQTGLGWRFTLHSLVRIVASMRLRPSHNNWPPRPLLQHGGHHAENA